MLGALFVGAVAAGVAWKYRGFLRDYVKGAGPARERIDGLLRTVQEKSEGLLDQAKDQLSSRIERTREKVRAGVSDEARGNPAEKSPPFSTATPAGTGFAAREGDSGWGPKP